MRYLVTSATLMMAVTMQALLAASALAAGPYSDDLSKCLVRSATTADKTLLVRWMFATMALHPAVKGLASVSKDQRTEINKATVLLIERLFTQDCLSEARDVVKYEGGDAIPDSFKLFGAVAMRELFTDPSVASGMTDFGNLADQKRLQEKLGLPIGK